MPNDRLQQDSFFTLLHSELDKERAAGEHTLSTLFETLNTLGFARGRQERGIRGMESNLDRRAPWNPGSNMGDRHPRKCRTRRAQ